MFRRLVIAAAVLLSGAAFAQNTDTGSIRVSGSVSSAMSLKVGAVTFTRDTTGSSISGDTFESDLAVIANFGDLASSVADGFQVLDVDLHVRSNRPYQISAVVQDMTAAPGSTVPMSKIGFVIDGVSYGDATAGAALVQPRSGAVVEATPDNTITTTDEILATLYDTAASWKSVDATTGVPSYSSTLATIGTTSTQVMEGPQISRGGSFASPNNKMVVSTQFAVYPEVLLTAGGFDYLVTFTAIQL